jgi:hypothetical protein
MGKPVMTPLIQNRNEKRLLALAKRQKRKPLRAVLSRTTKIVAIFQYIDTI